MEKIILGQDCIYEKNNKINQNILVCGSSGCGKTMSIIEPRLLETTETSLIVTLSKRRLVEMYSPLFKKRGYKVYDLNFINPDKSDVAYDPMTYVKNAMDILYLAQAITKMEVRKENSTADPYWDQTATSLLCAEIGYVLLKKSSPSFADVLQMNDVLRINMTDTSIETTLDKYFDDLEKNCKTNFSLCKFVINSWNTFRQTPYKTSCCILSTLNATLDGIFTPELRKMLRNAKNVSFPQIANEKSILFISSSAVNPALNGFINLFYSQAVKQLFEYAETCYNGVLPIPVHMMCDDFACGAKILNFAQYISIIREKRISVTLLLQSESQLEAMYDNEATTIINNCDTYVYMGGMDLKTCRNISARINWPLDEVLYMPVGQLIVFQRGQKPIVTERYDILADTRYNDTKIMYSLFEDEEFEEILLEEDSDKNQSVYEKCAV